MNSFFNSKLILEILVKWKFHLVAVGIIAIALSALFSSPIFMTPLYKSYAILYPSNISPYSDESETEQMVQLLQSGDIRDSIIRKFNLPRHWGIDSGYRYYRSTMEWEWSQKVSIGKISNEAVEVRVLDSDPQIASDMVAAIIDFYNIKVRSLHREKFEEVVVNYNYIMRVKQQYLDSLKARAQVLGTQHGILQYEAQTREVMRAWFQQKGSSEVQKYRKNLEEYGGEIQMLTEMIRAESDGLATLKLDADRARLDFHRKYTHANVISKPFPADKKSYPIRWLIVVFSTMAALFIAILVIGMIERRKFAVHDAADHQE